MKAANYKTRDFLHGMVRVDFFPYRNARMGSEADELEEQIGKALGIKNTKEDPRLGTLCVLLVYSKKMTFNWLVDAPQEWRVLEEMWNIWSKNLHPSKCWELYNSEAFDINVIYGWDPSKQEKEEEGLIGLEGWLDAFSSAMRPWAPKETRPVAQLTPVEAADPN